MRNELFLGPRKRPGCVGAVLIAAALAVAVPCRAEVIQYSYDDMNRLSRVEYPDGTVVDYVYDNLGNRLMKSTTLSGAPANSPPAAPINLSPSNGETNIPTTGLTLEWTAAADPDPGDAVAYYLYLGDSAPTPLVASGPGTNASPGRLDPLTIYSWYVVARDNHNANATGTVWTFTTADEAPTADFDANPTNGWAPLRVSFYDRSVSEHDAIVAWAWDFQNDGTVDSTGENPTFEYAGAGTYSVSLSVANSHGSTGTVTRTNLISLLDDTVMDLLPTTFSVEKAGVFRHLTVTYGVTNSGTTNYLGNLQWHDLVYLSSDAVLDVSDPEVGRFSRNQVLPAGAHYERSSEVTIPPGIEGTYYLIFKADGDDQIGEFNENNNTMAIQMSSPPDLAPTGFSKDGEAASGATLSISRTVQNAGGLLIDATWQDAVYLSTNAAWDIDDVLLDSFPEDRTLAPTASYTATNDVMLPAMVPGDYYLLLLVDEYDYVVESNEQNNVRSLSFSVSAPDLIPTGIDAPAQAVAGQQIEIITSVTNAGAGTASGFWCDWLVLSSNTVPEITDYEFTEGDLCRMDESLAGGESYRATNTVMLPNWPTGMVYLVLRTDRDEIIEEDNESNNDLAVAINLTAPDLVPLSITAPASAAPGDDIQVDLAVTNAGNGTAFGEGFWSDCLYLSSNTTWDAGDHLLDEFGACHWRDQPVTNGHTYSWTDTYSLPTWPDGTYYLILYTDSDEFVQESNETNNTLLAVSIELTSSALPDLVPTQLTAPAVAAVNATIDIVTRVANQGGGPAPGDPGWMDEIYLSSDAVWDPGDMSLGFCDRFDPLPSGQSYGCTNSPDLFGVAPGDYTIIFVADPFAQVEESNEGNNQLTTPISVVPEPPNLQAMIYFAMPDPQEAGLSVSVEGEIMNIGAASSGTANWVDRLYLSKDQTPDVFDYRLSTVARSESIEDFESWMYSETVRLPFWTPGSYYLILHADADDDLFESSEADNVSAYAFTLTAPDSDGDGLPNRWEDLHFPVTGGVWNVDTDLDGMLNWEELVANTDPQDDESVLKVTSLSPSGDTITIVWQGGTSSWQILECGSNLLQPAGTWQGIFTNPPPTPVTNLQHTTRDGGRYYRIRAGN